MKKVFLVLVVFLAMGTTFAQEKGLHLILGGSLGRTNFVYDLDEGKNNPGIGYGGYLGAQYFFNRHWGISLAGEYFIFKTQSYYQDTKEMFVFKNQIDDEGDAYDLTVRLKNWRENQRTHFIEIPLMGVYQHKWGRKERHGFYVGLGVKAQIPVAYSFAVDEKSKAQASAYYFGGKDGQTWNLPLGDGERGVELPQHAYGTAKPKWGGEHSLKTGFAAVGEIGFLLGLSRRVDLTLGVSIDYGFTNIYKEQEKKDLLGPKAGTTQQEGGAKPTDHVYYNGVLNSNQINYVNTTSLRGKVGLRIKIGKLKSREGFDEEEEDSGSKEPRKPIIDTIFVYPVVVRLPIPEGYEEYTGDEPIAKSVGRQPAPRGYEPIPDYVEEELIEPIYFDLDKYVLTAKSIEILDRKVALMKKYPQAVLTVVGNACILGTGGHNDVLSDNRANAAKMYLIRKGVSPTRIITVPLGNKVPTHPNDTEPNRALNRRVDFYLSH